MHESTSVPKYWEKYGVALAAVLLAVALRLSLPAALRDRPHLAFYPAVVVAAGFGGFWPGVLAVLMSLVCIHVLFEPLSWSTLHDPIAIQQVLIFLVGGIGISYIAERLRQAQARRREQSQKMDKLMTVMGLANILVRDPEDRIVCWNAGCGRLYGFSPEEAVGKRSHDLLKTRFPVPLEEIRETLFCHGRWQGELCHTTRDGRELIVASEWVLWRDPLDQSQSILEINTDITPLKRAEGKLANAASQRLLLAEACSRILTQTDVQKLFDTVVNAARELTGAHVCTCGHNYINGSFRIEATSFTEGRSPCPPGKQFKVEKGGVYLEPMGERRSIRLTDAELRHHPAWWGLPAEHGPLRGLLGVGLLNSQGQPNGLLMVSDKQSGEDFTDEDELLLWQLGSITSLAQQHIEARDAAESANRAKDHFLAVLSHELRTPLTPVVLGLSFLQSKPDLDPQIRETLDLVSRNMEAELRLINDLLDVMRIVRGKIELQKERVTLGTVIQHAIEVCRDELEAGQLHCNLDLGTTGPYWLEADVSRLEQVFWNLLKNSIKFTPPGGYVAIRCHLSGSALVIEVSDSGIGIEPERLPQVFNAFEQGERSITRQFGGLGLGLAISKAIVELHGGTIAVRSDGHNRGATFTVCLPFIGVTGTSAPEPTEPADSLIEPLHILLVEDHVITANMISMILSSKGHLVQTAGNIATALKLATEHQFHLLLSDLGLPDGTGYDLMRALRAEGHRFPGIALSGYGQEDDIRRSLEAGFARHITKPTSQSDLLAAVAAVAVDRGKMMAHGSPRGSVNEEPPDAKGSFVGHVQTGLESKSEPVHSGSSFENDTSNTMAGESHPVDDEVFNYEAAVDKCFGKHDLLRQMVGCLCTEAEPLLKRMKQAAHDRNAPELARAAHRLKGTLVHLAAPAALKAAKETERIGISGDFTRAMESVAELERQVEQLKQAAEDCGVHL